jgi:hypothetical protein
MLLEKEPDMAFSGRRCVLSWAMLALLCGVSLGCGDSKVKAFPARGEVFVDGQPADGAKIHFHPLDESRPPAFATVQPDGSFALTTYEEDDGAATGDYRVTVNWSEERKEDDELITTPDRLGGRYSKPEGSSLKATIDEGENEVPRFDLKSQ